MNRQKNQWEIRMTILLTVLCLLLLGLFSWFMATRGDSFLTSDESSELVLADILSREHKILTTSWRYSSELRLLNTQLVFAPLFYIFDDWGTVRVVGSTLLLLILALSALMLARAADLGTANSMVCALLMLVPFSDQHFKYVMAHSYYVPHIVISFITMAVLLRASDRYADAGGKKRTEVWLIDGFAAVLGIVTCMGGIRQLLILYFPLFLAASSMLAAQLWQERRGIYAPETERAYVRHLFASSVVVTFSAGIGYVINTLYLSKHYSFGSWNNIHFARFSAERFAEVLNGIASSLGYRTGEGVFSEALLMNAAFLGLLILLIAALADTLRSRNVHIRERALAIFFIAAAGLYTAVCTFTDFDLYDRYSLPIVVFAFPIVILFLRRKMADMAQRRRRALAAAGLALFCLPSLLIYARHRYREPSPYQGVVDAVLATDCRYGCSTFWFGNILTELSDGQIEMQLWTFSDINTVDNVNAVESWGQKTSHPKIPDGAVFCLFRYDQRDSFLARQMEGAEVIYETDQFLAYRFPSYQAMVDYMAAHSGA